MVGGGPYTLSTTVDGHVMVPPRQDERRKVGVMVEVVGA